MAGVAVRDSGSLGALWELAEPSLRWIVLDALRSTGRSFGADVVEDAVSDAYVALVHRAGSWRADGGAAPWNWARAMVRDCAFRALGVLHEDIDELDDPDDAAALAVGLDGERSAPTPPPVEDPLTVFERLARLDPAVAAKLAEFRRAVPRDRDLRIHLRLMLERAEGNPRPAVTVAADEGMTPAAVRQVAHRTERRLEGGGSGRCHTVAARRSAGPLRPAQHPRHRVA